MNEIEILLGGWAIASTAYALYLSSRALRASAYKELVRVKEETIRDLDQKVRKIRAQMGNMSAGPRVESGDTFDDVVSQVPKKWRWLAGPAIEWAKNNPQKVQELVGRLQKESPKGEAEAESGGV